MFSNKLFRKSSNCLGPVVLESVLSTRYTNKNYIGPNSSRAKLYLFMFFDILMENSYSADQFN